MLKIQKSGISVNPRKFARRFGHPKVDEILGGISIDRHRYAADALRRLCVVLGNNSDYTKKFLDIISKPDIKKLLENPPISSDWLKTMEEYGVLPTHTLLWMFIQNFSMALERMTIENEKIKHGGFNGSLLHKELEFTTQMRFRPSYKWMDFEEFCNLPILIKGMLIDRRKLDAILPTAIEAVNSLQFIMKMAEKTKGVPLLVIGNMTYGASFVVKPIEHYLKANGIHVRYERISSMSADCFMTQFSEAGIRLGWRPMVCPTLRGTLDFVEKYDPNIIIVDGTKRPRTYNHPAGRCTRFPAAMKGYFDTFEDLRPGYYGVVFQSAELTDTVLFGDYEEHKRDFRLEGDGGRKLVFLCPVGCEVDEGSYARLDDISEYSKDKRIGFGPNGFGEYKGALDPGAFLAYFEAKVKEAVNGLMKK
ncbi:hypothetical protein KJ780_04430 [Candidatus Micrarchaeota archaeon]|nr:hypothetical protein [Candidatus Micrarchaeota archaeon]